MIVLFHLVSKSGKTILWINPLNLWLPLPPHSLGQQLLTCSACYFHRVQFPLKALVFSRFAQDHLLAYTVASKHYQLLGNFLLSSFAIICSFLWAVLPASSLFLPTAYSVLLPTSRWARLKLIAAIPSHL